MSTCKYHKRKQLKYQTGVHQFGKRHFVNRLYAIAMAFIFSWLITGCASKNKLPEAPDDSPDIKFAQKTQVKNTLVRWGGEIISIRNEEEKTLIEVLAKPLNSSGTPKTQSSSIGRFIAVSSQFIDPKDVSKDDFVTVYGSVVDYEEKKIDAYNYLYPVVNINEYKAWPKGFDRRDYYYDPYWGPYYDPFYYGGGFYGRGYGRGYRNSLRGYYRHGY